MITSNISNFIPTLISQIPFDISNLQLDHFGYQTSSSLDYENLKKECLNIGELLSENIVSGRRVAIFKLNEPLLSNGFEILGFELVEPKEEQICDSELDHLEFVIPISFEEYIKLHKNVKWDMSTMNREAFPKIALKLNDGKSVKFHIKDIFEEIPD